MTNAAIDSYIEGYIKAQDYYERAAQACHNRIAEALSQNGIRHVASHRAKQRDRLQAKLQERESKDGKHYEKKEDIEDDIADLAGVRIVLYFPAEVAEAVRIIKELYPENLERTFPQTGQRKPKKGYTYRFTGYMATHLRVVLGAEGLLESAKHCVGAKVEVQVASMFMHAWSEVEHDLIYKPFRGEFSDDEYAWLDQINGLAMAGDLALERLQRTMNARIAEKNGRFRNHYDLASHILARVTHVGGTVSEPRMGRADKLLAYLAQCELDRPERLEQFLSPLSLGDSRSLVEQAVESVIASAGPGAPERREAWRKIEEATDVPSPYGDERPVDDGRAATYAIENRLIQHWATLDAAARRIAAKKSDGETTGIIDWLDTGMLGDVLGLNASMIASLVASHQTLTRLRFGTWHGSKEELEGHADVVREVIRRLYDEHRDILERGEQ
jgi:ppGpp synthetase/RelA/SpoT-type nucleotidyltranferase